MGTAQGTVLYVHGTLDSSASFARGARRYLPEWTAVTYDRRGWGHARRAGHSACGLSTHVADLLDILRRHTPSVVVGHSYGGLVVLSAVAKQPELVKAAVVYEPPVRWLPWWPEEAAWEALVREVGEEDPAEAAVRLRNAVLGGDMPRRAGRNVEAEREDGQAVRTEMSDPELYEVSFEPLTFKVPLVAAAGANSVDHHRRVTRSLAELVTHGEYVEIPGAEHIAHITDPGAFHGLVRHGEHLAGQLHPVDT